ncbi:MerR family transcriptional regulator [Nonomuraea sp. NPDC050310]|uniref:MerR family transcriptional regulator n=1 Tax=unclassified Nonomuraea TaxID=2593643 RepID=UPI0033CE34CF
METVRMAELSATTGVPVPTIKYYMREGLLAPGRPTGRNQAEYDDGHVRRLRLVRILVEYGGLSISVIKDLAERLDNPDVPLYSLLGAAQRTITERREATPSPHKEKAEQLVADLVARRGWRWEPDNPATRTAVGVLTALGEVGRQDMIDVLDDYAAAAERIAEADIRVLGDVDDRERTVEVVVIGTALGDPLVAALRRLAQATVARKSFEDQP